MAETPPAPPPLEKKAPTRKRPPRRLVFDRRYGWIVDEWKDPSEEALAGGRGMFCILPIAQAVLKVASQSVDFTVQSVTHFLEKPEKFSLRSLKASVDGQLRNFFIEKTQNQVTRPSSASPSGHTEP